VSPPKVTVRLGIVKVTVPLVELELLILRVRLPLIVSPSTVKLLTVIVNDADPDVVKSPLKLLMLIDNDPLISSPSSTQFENVALTLSPAVGVSLLSASFADALTVPPPVQLNDSCMTAPTSVGLLKDAQFFRTVVAVFSATPCTPNDVDCETCAPTKVDPNVAVSDTPVTPVIEAVATPW
jgi:hypothetical protein